MSRLVYECIAVAQDGTCTTAAFVPRETFPELKVADALELLGSALMLFVVCWGWKRIGHNIRRG